MKYKICHIILFLATVGMALSISVAEASEEPVIIGVPLPLSGNLQEFGMMMKNSFEVASDALKRTTSFSPKNIREALNRT